MKKSALSCGFLAVTFLLLVACTPSKKMNIPEVTEFLNTVAEGSDSISEAWLERSKDVYLRVFYSLSTDDFQRMKERLFLKKRATLFLVPK